MTVRRVVLYATTGAALTYIAARAIILRAVNRYDHAIGWYQRDTSPRSAP